jgi:hypothetical protein
MYLLEQGFSYIHGIRSRSQALLALAQIFAECGNPKSIQIDREGGLSNTAMDFFASEESMSLRQRRMYIIAAASLMIERRNQTWKGMCRAMLD